MILFKRILLSLILENNKVIVIENRQKIFQLQLQFLTFENLRLQLQQNRIFNYNFVNYNYNFSISDYGVANFLLMKLCVNGCVTSQRLSYHMAFICLLIAGTNSSK